MNAMLDSIEIKSFRAFSKFSVSQLGQINLVVGQNNIGKSCLLEALLLYARRSPEALWDLLEMRDEGNRPVNVNNRELGLNLLTFRHLFHGHTDIRDDPTPIQIGPLFSPASPILTTTQKYIEDIRKSGRASINPKALYIRPSRIGSEQLLEADDDYRSDSPGILGLDVMFGSNRLGRLEVSRSSVALYSTPLEYENLPATYIRAGDPHKAYFENLWDEVALTDGKREIIEALKIIAPGLQDVDLVGAPLRTAKVRLSNTNEPVALRSLGEGTNRLFNIALAAVNAKNGILLIDEIESGLHFSIQPEVWKLVFFLAQRLSIQVFATTHSWDCILAFQKAAEENASTTAELIALRPNRERTDEIAAVLFDQQELRVITREQLEVR